MRKKLLSVILLIFGLMMLTGCHEEKYGSIYVNMKSAKLVDTFKSNDSVYIEGTLTECGDYYDAAYPFEYFIISEGKNRDWVVLLDNVCPLTSKSMKDYIGYEYRVYGRYGGPGCLHIDESLLSDGLGLYVIFEGIGDENRGQTIDAEQFRVSPEEYPAWFEKHGMEMSMAGFDFEEKSPQRGYYYADALVVEGGISEGFGSMVTYQKNAVFPGVLTRVYDRVEYLDHRFSDNIYVDQKIRVYYSVFNNQSHVVGWDDNFSGSFTRTDVYGYGLSSEFTKLKTDNFNKVKIALRGNADYEDMSLIFAAVIAEDQNSAVVAARHWSELMNEYGIKKYYCFVKLKTEGAYIVCDGSKTYPVKELITSVPGNPISAFRDTTVNYLIREPGDQYITITDRPEDKLDEETISAICADVDALFMEYIEKVGESFRWETLM